jgi:hypothetical protein
MGGRSEEKDNCIVVALYYYIGTPILEAFTAEGQERKATI